MHDLSTLSLDIDNLLTAYRTHLLTPQDVVTEIYARIKRKGDLGIWTHLCSQSDVVEQIEKTMALPNAHSLPLFGIPFCVKDNIHVKGLPTTASCPAFVHMPKETATVVEKLLAAGAILIGKNTMDQFATGLVGVRSPSHPVNPFNPEYIPGGSSSGSAVAVSMSIVSFSLGSDTGGSGRVPAALNNIVGLKPTPGSVSAHGMVYANRSFDCVPIFALYCRDAKKVLGVIQGADKKDPFSYDIQNISHSFQKEKTLTIGVPQKSERTFFGDRLAEHEYNVALQKISAMGGELIEIDFSLFIEAGKMLFDGPLIAERLASLENFIQSHPEDVHPVVKGLVKKASAYSAVDLCRAYYRLKTIKAEIDVLFSKIDMMMVPTTGTIYKIEDVKSDPVNLNANMGYYTYYANILKLAAVAMPSSIREDGLPFGVCFVANTLNDFALVNFCLKWEEQNPLKAGAPQ